MTGTEILGVFFQAAVLGLVSGLGVGVIAAFIKRAFS
jgi:hypothetical protein